MKHTLSYIFGNNRNNFATRLPDHTIEIKGDEIDSLLVGDYSTTITLKDGQHVNIKSEVVPE